MNDLSYENQNVIDPRQFIGKKVKAYRELKPGAKPDLVTIHTIQGNAALPGREGLVNYFVINGTHHCHMLSYFIQLIENRDPTAEEMIEFNLASQIKEIKEI